MKGKTSVINLVLTVAAIIALVNTGNASEASSQVASATASTPPVGAVPAVSVSLASTNSTAPQAAVVSGFTYQGSLKNGGSPANGQYDFQFTLYDALTGGNLVGNPVTITNVTVTGGLFSVTLDFGQLAFTGDARYLEIAVRQTGGGTYTTLTPRQPLTPAPYALSLKPGAVISGTTNVNTLTVTNTGSGMGVQGISTNSTGVYGNSANSEGVHGETGSNFPGVYGHNTSPSTIGAGPGVRGDSDHGPGVYGFSAYYKGVYGQSTSSDGVLGTSDSGSGMAGISNSWFGVYGRSNTDYAGYFDGDVNVTGTCCAAAEGTYRIDHPLDPANKYLNQSAVESPDMKTIYDGIATLDERGEAWVVMPSYSQSLDQDFRYQLTPIGAPGRDLYIAQEIQSNRFKIAGGQARMKVSWQVTGIRNDPYAKQHPVPVEQNKPANEKGKYLHPAEYGQPETMGIVYEHSQSAKQLPSELTPATPGR